VAAARTTDLDGVLIELVERPAEAPVFSHLRINVTDLDASVAWYEHLGFKAGATERVAEAVGTVFSYASMVTDGDPSFSLELTQWQTEGRRPGRLAAYHRGPLPIALGVDDVNAPTGSCRRPQQNRCPLPSLSSCLAPARRRDRAVPARPGRRGRRASRPFAQPHAAVTEPLSTREGSRNAATEVDLTPESTALVVVECQGGTVGAESALPSSRRPPRRPCR